MGSKDTQYGEPTRREWLKYGGAVAGGGLLAGCVSGPGSEGETSTEGSSYTATLAPAGEVTFESVPEDVFTILGHHVDMVLALGRSDSINAMHAPGYHQSLYQKFVHHLDGVSIDWEGMYSSWPPSEEKLFELDSDVHIADPAKVSSADGWGRNDVEEIADTVAPWFGNTLSDTHQTPPDAWSDAYEYHTLWEIFERVAAVFKEQQRYEALANIHSSVLTTIEESLPPESERPSATMVLFSSQDDSIWGYRINQPGYYAAHSRPLGATDALVEVFGSDFGESGNNTIDYEALLEADPDVLLVLGPMSGTHNIETIRSDLENHEVASEIAAVQNGRVYTQGARRQGPILNLFQLEMAAKQLYPDQFGEWPGYQNGEPYPEIPEDEQLFDRDRLARIVTDGA